MNKNKSGLTSTDIATNAIAKLRRLKIQESVLYSSVHKVFSTSHEHEEFCTTFKGNNELKQYLSTIKNTFIDIKNLLEDVKISTNSSDTMEQIDINEVKRDVLNLEAKLASFKSFLQKEIATLKIRFSEIQCELKGKRFKEHKNYKPHEKNTKQFTEIVTSPVRVLINSPFKCPSRVRVKNTKQFTEIVTSPVRVLINSPFECPEVQNFQAFIKNSQRYGGWNEYNHNIFVQIWNKHFHMDNVDVLINVCNSDENIDRFQSFNEDVLQKIPDITLNDIISHNKWYSEYVYLKNCQQKALEKWKDNKTKIKKSRQQQYAKHELQSNRLTMLSGTAKSLIKKQADDKDGSNRVDRNFPHNSNSGSTGKCNSEEIAANIKKITNNSIKMLYTSKKCSRTTKPTEHRTNKGDGKKEDILILANVQGKRQLRIPTWRLGLYENKI